MAYKALVRVNVRCPTHKRFNPERNGLGAVKGGCKVCEAMVRLDNRIYQAERIKREIEEILAQQAA